MEYVCIFLASMFCMLLEMNPIGFLLLQLISDWTHLFSETCSTYACKYYHLQLAGKLIGVDLRLSSFALENVSITSIESENANWISASAAQEEKAVWIQQKIKRHAQTAIDLMLMLMIMFSARLFVACSRLNVTCKQRRQQNPYQISIILEHKNRSDFTLSSYSYSCMKQYTYYELNLSRCRLYTHKIEDIFFATSFSFKLLKYFSSLHLQRIIWWVPLNGRDIQMRPHTHRIQQMLRFHKHRRRQLQHPHMAMIQALAWPTITRISTFQRVISNC